MSEISKKTIKIMAKLFELGYTMDRIEMFFEGEGISREIFEMYSPRGKEVFSAKVMYWLYDNGSQDVLKNIAEGLIQKTGTSPMYVGNYKGSKYDCKLEDLLLSLAADGLKLINKRLVPTVDEEFSFEENMLKQNLHLMEFDEAVNYLDQSYENFISKNWEASNSMTRTFLEFVTTAIAKRIAFKNGDNVNFKGHKMVRKYLRTHLLDEKEFLLLTDFMHWCSGNGSHPGVSDENECRLRRIFTTGLCQYYLEKYQNKFLL